MRVKVFRKTKDSKIIFWGCPYNKLCTLSCRNEKRGFPATPCWLSQLIFFNAFREVFHRTQDRLLAFLGSEQCKAFFCGEFNIDAHAISVLSNSVNERWIRTWNHLCVYISAESMLLPKKQKCLKQILHCMVRRFIHARAQE